MQPAANLQLMQQQQLQGCSSPLLGHSHQQQASYSNLMHLQSANPLTCSSSSRSWRLCSNLTSAWHTQQ
jgi:hypothetical protein